MQNYQDDDDDEEQDMTINRRKIQKKPAKRAAANGNDDDDKNDHVVSRPIVQDPYLLDDPCEEIKESAQNAINQKKEDSYDLEKGLSIKVASDRKVIQCSKTNSQRLTSVVSLRTLEVTNQEDQNIQELNPSENRLAVDLIAVIDTSGSMSSNNKMKNAQDALYVLLPFFSERDRFGVVKFQALATKILGLKRVHAQENEKMYDEVFKKRLYPTGSTSIPAGIAEAIKMLQNRGVHKNKVVSIFLLSDGNDNDNNAIEAVKRILEEKAVGLDFTIHTFGFGDDHDSNLLSSIAKLGKGNFYYIQDLEKINECFVNAFGGLLSIVGREAKLSLKLEKTNNQIKELSDLKWLKPYGDFWTLDEQTNEYQVDIQNLLNGMKRDYVIDMQIPRITSKINPNNREHAIMTCVIKGKNIQTNQEVVKTAKLNVKFYEEDEESKEAAQENELSEDVVFNILRVEVAEMMISAKNLAEENKNDQAIKEIETLINKVLVSKYAKTNTLIKMVEQLENAKQSVRPEVFNDYGRHELTNEGERTMNQRGLKAKKLKQKKEAAQQQDSDSDSDNNENTIQRTMKRKIVKKQDVPAVVKNDPHLSTILEQSATKEIGQSTINEKK